MGNFIDYLGFFSGICTTIAFVPQLLKIWLTKSAKDISMLMFLIFFLGICCWILYGYLTNDKPILIANILTMILSVGIIIGKIKFDK